MKINCLIVDDEQYARRLLEDYTGKVAGLALAGSCRNAMEALQILNSTQVDLLFLDIQMPDLTGVELLKTLPHRPAVIFTTAYQEYALEGYELDIIDYMLKPITFERFLKGVNKAMDLIRLRQAGGIPQEEGSGPATQTMTHINIKADSKIHRLSLDQILFIEGLKEYVRFHTPEQRYVVLDSLKRLEGILPGERFLRVHKSYIINTGKVNALYGNTIEIGNHQIPVGKSFTEQVRSFLFRT